MIKLYRDNLISKHYRLDYYHIYLLYENQSKLHFTKILLSKSVFHILPLNIN
jgi:hypothetical protein